LFGTEQSTHGRRSGGLAELDLTEKAGGQPDAYHNSFVPTAQLMRRNILFEANHFIYVYWRHGLISAHHCLWPIARLILDPL
jgi:hypothetical protein